MINITLKMVVIILVLLNLGILATVVLGFIITALVLIGGDHSVAILVPSFATLYRRIPREFYVFAPVADLCVWIASHAYRGEARWKIVVRLLLISGGVIAAIVTLSLWLFLRPFG